MNNIIRFQSKAERFKDDIFKRGTMNPHRLVSVDEIKVLGPIAQIFVIAHLLTTGQCSSDCNASLKNAAEVEQFTKGLSIEVPASIINNFGPVIAAIATAIVDGKVNLIDLVVGEEQQKILDIYDRGMGNPCRLNSMAEINLLPEALAQEVFTHLINTGQIVPAPASHVPMQWSGKTFSIEVNQSVSEKLLQVAKAIQKCDITIVDEQE